MAAVLRAALGGVGRVPIGRGLAAAAAAAEPRCYFYSVDLHGRLYLDEGGEGEGRPVRSYANCFKDEKFLDLFWRGLEPTPGNDRHRRQYRWMSVCGRERAYTRVADTPVVFHTLERTSLPSPPKLVYAGSLEMEFQPEGLAINESNGRLYHPVPAAARELGPWGLLSSKLALQLGKHIEWPADDWRMQPAFVRWDDQRHVLRVLTGADSVRSESTTIKLGDL